MSGFNETNTVQAWLVERAVGLGWEHIPGHALPRDVTDVICEEWLVEALVRLNPMIAEDESRLDEVLPLIRSAILSANTEGLLAANERLTTLLRGEMTVKYIGTDKYEPVRVIDFENLDNNRFTVSGPLPGSTNPDADEVTYGPPGNARRFDVVLWVNGIPLVVKETKTPVKASVSWLNGARDIANVYEVEKPEFFAPNVLVVATEGREFHYGAVGQPARKGGPTPRAGGGILRGLARRVGDGVCLPHLRQRLFHGLGCRFGLLPGGGQRGGGLFRRRCRLSLGGGLGLVRGGLRLRLSGPGGRQLVFGFGRRRRCHRRHLPVPPPPPPISGAVQDRFTVQPSASPTRSVGVGSSTGAIGVAQAWLDVSDSAAPV